MCKRKIREKKKSRRNFWEKLDRRAEQKGEWKGGEPKKKGNPAGKKGRELGLGKVRKFGKIIQEGNQFGGKFSGGGVKFPLWGGRKDG